MKISRAPSYLLKSSSVLISIIISAMQSLRTLLLLSIVILLFPYSKLAAQTNAIYYPSDPSHNTFTIKAFSVPTFLFINGMNGSLGVEYGFKKRHSVGVSIVYTESGSKMSYNDSTQKAAGYPFLHSVDRGVLVYYRYYTKGWYHVLNSDFRPYASGFVRFGNHDWHHDKNYETNQIKYDEQQFSTGVLVGVVTPLEVGGLCVDANIGPFWKWKNTRDEHLENAVAVVDYSKEQKLGLKVGLTLSYVLKRGKAY